MMFCSLQLFSSSPTSGRMRYAPTIFLMAQKQTDSYIMICAMVSQSQMSSQMVNLHLPGVNGAFAIGNHGLKSEQNTSATCEMRAASCAKRLSHLPKWNCPSDNGASAIAIGLCTAAQAVHLNCVWIIVVIANACSLLGLKECSSVRLPFAMDMLVSPVKNESAQQSIVITAQTI